jgi:anti-sigma factor RsiW
MNECQNLQQQLDDYLSDRLSDFARRRIDNHLRGCPECADEVDCYRGFIKDLRSAADAVNIEPSLTLQCNINRMVATPSRAEVINRYYLSLILGGMMLILAATLLGLLDHFGTYDIAFSIRLTTALLGSAVIASGIYMRRLRSINK